MQIRDRRVEVRFTQDEYNKLAKKAQRAHMPVGGFIRCCVDTVQIREGPSADVPLLLREVRQNSVLLDQLVQARGEVEGVRLAQLLDQMQEVERMIVEAYSPR